MSFKCKNGPIGTITHDWRNWRQMCVILLLKSEGKIEINTLGVVYMIDWVNEKLMSVAFRKMWNTLDHVMKELATACFEANKHEHQFVSHDHEEVLWNKKVKVI